MQVQLNFLHFQSGEADALSPAQTKHLLNVLVVRPITFLIGNVSSFHELLSFRFLLCAVCNKKKEKEGAGNSLSVPSQVEEKEIHQLRHRVALLSVDTFKNCIRCGPLSCWHHVSPQQTADMLYIVVSGTAFLGGLWLLRSLRSVAMGGYWFNPQGLWSYPWSFTHCYDNKASLGGQWEIILFALWREMKWASSFFLCAACWHFNPPTRLPT